MLVLPIKKEWYDMILSGEKKEEYREIKPYWTTRILHELGYKKEDKAYVLNILRCVSYMRMLDDFVMLKNGYGKNSRVAMAGMTVRIGTGKEKWGAEPGKEYYVFEIQDFLGGVSEVKR